MPISSETVERKAKGQPVSHKGEDVTLEMPRVGLGDSAITHSGYLKLGVRFTMT